MNKITNRQAICDTLLEASKTDRDIVVLCSDSRGSASMTPFAKTYPEQFHICRAGGLRQESFCCFTSMFFIDQKL